MLGYVMVDGRGATDALLLALSERLQAKGLRLTGAVQINTELSGGMKCRMELLLLPSGDKVQISQSLGAFSKGCRLDPDGLEQAVHHAEKGLEAGAEIVVINKFGKQELEGRGFRSLIGTALSEGIPVIVGVNSKNVEGFLEFAGEFAEAIPADLAAAMSWCEENM